MLDAREPESLARLAWVREYKQTQHLVWEAEQAKIQMTDEAQFSRFINLLDEQYEVPFSQERFADVSAPLLEKIGELADEALRQAQLTPDVIFVTGGTARSPVIQQWLRQRYAASPIVMGDHFGSVIAGLARWADRCFA